MDKFKIDSNKLMYHPRRVAQVLDAQNDWELAKEVYPIFAEISPNNFCPHSCSFCGVDYAIARDSRIDLEVFKTRIKELGILGLKALMFAGEGEPLLYKNISEMVKATKESGIDVSFTTNGVPMNEKFIQESMKYTAWIKVSFNAGSRENYAKIHGTKERDFDIVLDNIRYATAYKKQNGYNCSIGMQMVLLDENAHEVEDFILLAKSVGVDYVVIKKYSQHNFSKTHLHENIDYTKYYELNETVNSYNEDGFSVVFRSNSMVESEPYAKCLSTPNIWMYIDSKMDVYACSAYLLQDRFNLGNLKDNTFQEIWQGDKRKALFEEGIDISECRKGCRMDSCNRYLDAIVNNSVEHVNFI